eukprot:7397624-Pyramimonas_sp.AAC.1
MAGLPNAFLKKQLTKTRIERRAALKELQIQKQRTKKLRTGLLAIGRAVARLIAKDNTAEAAQRQE